VHARADGAATYGLAPADRAVVAIASDAENFDNRTPSRYALQPMHD
jgi:hypothetical protein